MKLENLFLGFSDLKSIANNKNMKVLKILLRLNSVAVVKTRTTTI